MAIRASELLLIVRAQNQASGALRRIAGDVRGLGRLQDLQMRRNQLAINQMNTMRQRQRILNELQSITSGPRALGLEQRRIALAQRDARIAAQRNGLLQKQRTLQTAMNAARQAQQLQLDRQFKLETQRMRLAKHLKQAELDAIDIAKQRKSLLAQQRRGGLADPSAIPALDAVRAAKGRSGLIARDLETNARASAAAAAAYGLQGQRLKDLNRASALAGQQLTNNAHRATEMSVAQRRLVADTAALAARESILKSELATVNARTAQQAAQVRVLNKEIRKARWEPVAAGGRVLQHTARVAQMAGLVITASLGAAAHSAAQFNKESTLAATQTGRLGTGIEVINRNAKVIESGILRLMQEFPAAQSEMAAGAYEIFSSTDLGLRNVAGGMKLLSLFNKAAVAGSTSLNEVTQTGISVMNGFKLGVGDMEGIMNRSFAAVRFGRMTFAEFTQSLNQLVPSAIGANQSFDTIAGTMAALTRRMPNVRMAGTALARLMELFGRKKFVEGAHDFGVEITDINGKIRPLPKLITEFRTAIDKLPLKERANMVRNLFKELSNTEGTIQARRALQHLLAAPKDYRRIMGLVIHDNNEFGRSLASMEKTTGVRWDVFTNRLRALALQIGASVLPAFLELGDEIQKILNWWNKLDKGTRDQIGRWTAYSGIILLVGSAVAWVAGSFIRLFAALGGARAIISGTFVLFAAGAVALAALRGDVHSLSDAVDVLMNSFTSHGIIGWIALMGLGAVAALKLARAIRAVGAASAVGGAASGAGGLLSMLGGMGRGARNARGAASITRDVMRGEGAALKLRAALAGAGAAAMMIPGGIAIAGAGIAVAAGATLLWKHHMDGVRKDAEAIARIRKIATDPKLEASRLAGLGGDARGVASARLNINAINRQIKGASGDNLKRLYLERADALDALDAANAKADRSFNSLSRSLDRQGRTLATLGSASKNLGLLQKNRARMQWAVDNVVARGGKDQGNAALRMFDDRIQRVTAHMAILKKGALDGARTLSVNFARAVTGMSRGNLIPKVSGQQIQDLFKFALSKKRMLTIPEIRAYIRADVSPASLRKARADIRAAVTGAQGARSVAAGKASIVAIKPKIVAPANFLKYPFGKSPVQLLTSVRKPPNTAKVRAGVAAVFRKTIVQHIRISPGVNAARAQGAAIGAAIAQGAQAGIESQAHDVAAAAAKMVSDAVGAARAAAGNPKSPAPVTIPLGKSLSEGIAKGILLKRGDIAKAARLTLDIFQGSVLQNFDEGATKKASKLTIERKRKELMSAQRALAKQDDAYHRQRVKVAKMSLDAAQAGTKAHPLTPAILTKDLKAQLKSYKLFNTSLATLAKRGAPKELLDQLGALGVEGADKIAILARMSKPQLAAYVKLWKQAQAEIKKSADTTAEDVKAATAQMIKDAAQNMLDMWNGFNDTNKSNFGELFAGLGDKVGDSFNSAVTDYQNSLVDYQTQIKDLNTQAIEAQKQAVLDKIADLQSVMGTLFSGDWLSGTEVQIKLDWGQKLGFDDLFKDLDTQVTKFDRWRSDLASLAGKVPAELAKQLEALGPEAVDRLDTLNSATGDQLNRYVTLWQRGQDAIGNVAGGTIADTSDILKQIDDINVKLGALVAPKALTSGDVQKSLQDQVNAWGSYQNVLQSLLDRGVPRQLVQQLAQMGPESLPYLKALNDMTGDQLFGVGGFVSLWNQANSMINDSTNFMMNNQLQMWYAYGANAAAQLIAGVGSQQQPLIDYFTKLFESLLAGRLPTYNPPGYNPAPIIGNPATGGGLYGDPRRGAQQGGDVNITQNIYPSEGESLMTTLERSNFRLIGRMIPV